MSVISDCGLMYLSSITWYAKKYNISIDEVRKIFEDHQVMEKIIVNHGYLHQSAECYIQEYVEEVLTEDKNQIVVYHGTNSIFDFIDLKKSRDRVDFGKGFYTTLLEDQAKEWGKYKALKALNDSFYVYKFILKYEPSLKIKRFETVSSEWFEIVCKNRTSNTDNNDYDIIIGPVADDNTLPTIQRYLAKEISEEQAIKILEYAKINNQVSLHTQKAVDCLYWLGKEKYYVRK